MHLPCLVTVVTQTNSDGVGAGGKHHSAVVTSDGDSYTFGSNLHGQCGTGSIKSKDKVEGQVDCWSLHVKQPLQVLPCRQLQIAHSCLCNGALPLPYTVCFFSELSLCLSSCLA